MLPAALAVQYTPVNILARMNLFVPLAIGMVLFPKATQRHAQGKRRPTSFAAGAGGDVDSGDGVNGRLLSVSRVPHQSGLSGAVPGSGQPVGIGRAGDHPVCGYQYLAELCPFGGGNGRLSSCSSSSSLPKSPPSPLYPANLQTVALIMVGAGLLGNLAGAVTLLKR
ncbi:MAG: hypothetical protein M5U34_43865 [Chloroflexi bacterium]|nr:hypothetical protein [Chloroflexota bacterium]